MRLSEKIRFYDELLEHMGQTRYRHTAVLKQVAGVGTLTALTFVLTIDNPERFQRSRDVGCFLGLRPKQQDSGERSPQLRITKAGDTDLRRWGLKLCERGGKNGKKRAVVAVARKLAVLLHRLWVTGEVYEPLRNSRIAAATAKQAA